MCILKDYIRISNGKTQTFYRKTFLQLPKVFFFLFLNLVIALNGEMEISFSNNKKQTFNSHH